MPAPLLASRAVLSLALLGSLAAAADPITIGETLKVTSKVLGEERTILVSTPSSYSRSPSRFPVLYLTDGDSHLLHTRATVDFLARNGLMPDLIVVGIANTERSRDLTPTRRTRPDGRLEDASNAGGAGRFLDFIEKELVPFVEARYRTAPYRVLAGHSLGGLFALTALTTRPGLFDAFVSVSPSLSWDGDVILRQTEAFLKERKELRAGLFVTMANEETGTPPPTGMERLRTILQASAPAGLSWDLRLLPEEDHGSVVLQSHYWALRRLFAGWRLPADPATGRFAGSVDDLKKHYAGLSARLGVTILPPEDAVNQVGYQHLLAGDVDGALPFFRFNVELRPDSANVHDSLGEALEKAGQLPGALLSYGKAVEKAKKLEDPRLPIYTRNRDRVSRALGQG